MFRWLFQYEYQRGTFWRLEVKKNLFCNAATGHAFIVGESYLQAGRGLYHLGPRIDVSERILHPLLLTADG